MKDRDSSSALHVRKSQSSAQNRASQPSGIWETTFASVILSESELCIQLSPQNSFQKNEHTFKKRLILEFLWGLSGLRTWLASIRTWVGSPAPLSGLRIQCGRRWSLDLMWLWLWCNCSSGLTSSLGTSICCGFGPKKEKKKRKKSNTSF